MDFIPQLELVCELLFFHWMIEPYIHNGLYIV